MCGASASLRQAARHGRADRPEAADRRAEHHEVGAAHGGGGAGKGAVGDAEREDARARLGRGVAGDDLAGEAVAAQDARDGGPDQPEPDDRDAAEERLLSRHRLRPS
jgi:hypothetical protein